MRSWKRRSRRSSTPRAPLTRGRSATGRSLCCRWKIACASAPASAAARRSGRELFGRPPILDHYWRSERLVPGTPGPIICLDGIDSFALQHRFGTEGSRRGSMARTRAQDVILEILRSADGEWTGKARLFKAFYFAHLYYASERPGRLTDWPIVRMPQGPGIDRSEELFEELKEQGQLISELVHEG